jgi:hypothetical protein
MNYDDAKRGLKEVKRKKLVYQYEEFLSLMGIFRSFQIISQEQPVKLIPYMCSITKAVPRSAFRISSDVDAIQGYLPIPWYLENEFIQLEAKLQDTYDVDRQLLRVNQMLIYSASALMSLLPKFKEMRKG